jgi:hypothetical protein
MDSEPSSSKQEEEDEKICKQQASSSSYFTSLQGSPSRWIAAGAASLALLVIALVVKYTPVGLLHHEFTVNVSPELGVAPLSPSKLLEEVLRNKDAYLSQLANQDWWNVFMSEYNITIPPSLLLPQSKKKRLRPGFEMANKGATAKYPIIMIPGFVTSGLEFWGSGQECARTQKYHFRQRLWTAVGSAKSFLGDRECWRQHMLLHPWTGGDPDDPPIRLRAAT